MHMRISGPAVLLGVFLGVLLACAGCGTGPSGTPAGGSVQGSGSPSASPSHVLNGRLVGRLRLDGLAQPLLITRTVHPRGGSQTRVYVGGGVELTDTSGNPLVPFVATDTRPTSHVSIACVTGGLQVTTAQPTVPSGVLVGWDIDRTTYRVDRSGAHASGRERVATSVPERTMRTKWPDLAHDRLFVGCRQWSAPVT